MIYLEEGRQTVDSVNSWLPWGIFVLITARMKEVMLHYPAYDPGTGVLIPWINGNILVQ
jgi:hypothetical protein